MTCSVLQFTVPNSIYNINSTNNIFDMSEKINNILIHYHLLISYGNYNVNTFIKQFITSLSFYSSNFELTFNPITGKFYLKNTASNQFIIHATSTIRPVMGFIEGAELGSSYDIYI